MCAIGCLYDLITIYKHLITINEDNLYKVINKTQTQKPLTRMIDIDEVNVYPDQVQCKPWSIKWFCCAASRTPMRLLHRSRLLGHTCTIHVLIDCLLAAQDHVILGYSIYKSKSYTFFHIETYDLPWDNWCVERAVLESYQVRGLAFISKSAVVHCCAYD